jgi:hydrogenase/urease accessory protein HupE
VTRIALLAVLAFTALAARFAAAHAIGLSRGEYRTLPDGVEVRLVFDGVELGALLEGIEAAPGAARDAALAFSSSEGRAAIERRIVQGVRVRDRDGQLCPGTLSGIERVVAPNPSGLPGEPKEHPGVQLTASYRCAAGRDGSDVELGFWDVLNPGHRHLALRAPSGAAAAPEILHAGQPHLAFAGASPAPHTEAPSFVGWLTLGIEHILEGYDHLLFLLALVIVMPVARTLAATVSIFTLAHSITLALASLRVVTPPSGWVECAIALSIVYVGLDNLSPRAARPRFAIVFGFGLIHGFGFAGALAELGLPAAEAPGALLSFNAGVELGQLAVLAVVFPLVQQARRTRWFVRRAVPALSLVTALVGAVWFFERV